MLTAVLVIWSVLVFGAYGYCVIHQIEPIFYLWLAFAAIGAIFVIMDGTSMILGRNDKTNQHVFANEQAKENIRNRRKSAQNFTPFSSLLAYMTVPLIICILCNYLIF